MPAALTRVYGLHDRSKPWKCEDHVFDFESGLRLVVTLKVIDYNCDPCLHVVADVMRGTLLHDLHYSMRYDRNAYDWGGEHLKRMVPGQFKELAPVSLEFLGHDGGLIPHFFGDAHEVERREQRFHQVERRAV